MLIYGVKQETNYKKEVYLIDPLFFNREEAKQYAIKEANRFLRMGDHVRVYDEPEKGVFLVLVLDEHGYERELYSTITLEVI